MSRAVPVPKDFWDPKYPTQPTKEFRTWCELVARALAEINNGGTFTLTIEDEGTPLATGATTLDFVGSGVTATGAGAEKTITISGGAPTDAQYVTMALNGSLSAERVLTAGTGISITDGGANGNVTVAATGTSVGDNEGLMPAITRGRWCALVPIANSAPTYIGCVAALALSWSGPAQALTSRLAFAPRYRGTSNTTADSRVGMLLGGGTFIRGDATVPGGYFWELVFGTDVIISDSRLMIGFTSSNADLGAAQEPLAFMNGALVHGLVLALDSTDSELQIIKNDGSTGSAVKTSLGASWPRPSNNDMYRFRAWCTPGGSSISWTLENILTAATTSGVESTNIPGATSQMYSQIAVGTKSTSGTAVQISILGWYFETPI